MDDPLDPAQRFLLDTLVRAWRSISSEQRQPFRAFTALPNWSNLQFVHPGLDQRVDITYFDFGVLRDAGFIRVVKQYGDGQPNQLFEIHFIVTNAGLEHIDRLRNPPVQGLLLEARELLASLVEAWNSLPRGQRQSIRIPSHGNRVLTIEHPGLPNGKMSIPWEPLNNLKEAGFVDVRFSPSPLGPLPIGVIGITAEGRDYVERIGTAKPQAEQLPVKNRVFVVYGRNGGAHSAIKLFLRALKLDPLDFDEVRNQLGGSPFVGDIVYAGLKSAQAILVLFTPDEYAALRPGLVKERNSNRDKHRWQPRPNVLIEAGMALAIDERRTILVTIGDVDMASDLHGRHFIRLDNSPEQRSALRSALIGTGCAVDEHIGDMNNTALAGDFEACIKSPMLPEVNIVSPFRD